MTDKGTAYAKERTRIYEAGGAIGFDEWAGREAELAAAYRAGEAEGYAAANRKVTVSEGPLNPTREL